MGSVTGGDRAPNGELAGRLRTVINRLGFHLRTPATRHGLTPTRLAALAALARAGPQRPGDLAERLGITAASMSRLAEALEQAGWVRRDPVPDDRRACLLGLTDRGAAALDELRREGTGWLADAIATLAPAQRRTLAAALPILESLTDQRLAVGGSSPNPLPGARTDRPPIGRPTHARRLLPPSRRTH